MMMIAIIRDEKNPKLCHLRHLGNDVHSFTLKLKENREYALPLYVTDKNTRFCLLDQREVGVDPMCQVAANECECVQLYLFGRFKQMYFFESMCDCVRAYACIENLFCHFKLVLLFVVFFLFFLPTFDLLHFQIQFEIGAYWCFFAPHDRGTNWPQSKRMWFDLKLLSNIECYKTFLRKYSISLRFVVQKCHNLFYKCEKFVTGFTAYFLFSSKCCCFIEILCF